MLYDPIWVRGDNLKHKSDKIFAVRQRIHLPFGCWKRNKALPNLFCEPNVNKLLWVWRRGIYKVVSSPIGSVWVRARVWPGYRGWFFKSEKASLGGV
jgi:hypothetical protein